MNLRLVSGKIEKGTGEAAGFDLFYAGTEPLLIGDTVVKVPTGVRTVIDKGYCAVVREKSGLASKGIESKGGLIDSDYRGEWIVMLRKPADAQWFGGTHNNWVRSHKANDGPFVLEPGMKVAQFIILPVPEVSVICEGHAEFIQHETVRGEGGFGSTGK